MEQRFTERFILPNNGDLERIGLTFEVAMMDLSINLSPNTLSFHKVAAMKYDTNPEDNIGTVRLNRNTIYEIGSKWPNSYNRQREHLRPEERAISDHWLNDPQFADQFSSIDNLKHYCVIFSNNIHLHILAVDFNLKPKIKMDALDQLDLEISQKLAQ